MVELEIVATAVSAGSVGLLVGLYAGFRLYKAEVEMIVEAHSDTDTPVEFGGAKYFVMQGVRYVQVRAWEVSRDCYLRGECTETGGSLQHSFCLPTMRDSMGAVCKKEQERLATDSTDLRKVPGGVERRAGKSGRPV